MIMTAQDPYFTSYYNEIHSGLPVAQRGFVSFNSRESNQTIAENVCFL